MGIYIPKKKKCIWVGKKGPLIIYIVFTTPNPTPLVALLQNCFLSHLPFSLFSSRCRGKGRKTTHKKKHVSYTTCYIKQQLSLSPKFFWYNDATSNTLQLIKCLVNFTRYSKICHDTSRSCTSTLTTLIWWSTMLTQLRQDVCHGNFSTQARVTTRKTDCTPKKK